MKVVFKENTKVSKPLLIRNIVPYINKKEYNYSLKFTKESTYEFDKQADQDDWRKACGVTFNRLDNHELCAMVSYRFNKDLNLFEISPYFHYNYSKSWVGGGGNYKDPNDLTQGLDKKCILYLPIDEEAKINLSFKNELLTYTFTIQDKTQKFYFDFKPKLISWEIQPWFGGTNTYEEATSFELNIL